jgi:PD-(D/E)XK nuclease superfamily
MSTTHRLVVPTRLPARLDGRPTQHLSASSYNKWQSCRESWRRHYLLGHREPASPAMFIGARVDDALTAMYEHRLAGEQLDADQVADCYREHWQTRLGEDVKWSDEEPAPKAFELGLAALRCFTEELAPGLGEPVAVQRRVEFRLAEQVEWSVLGYIDLESQLLGEGDEPPLSLAADYKVRGSVPSQFEADNDPQASIYLAARELEGSPADRFVFAVMRKPARNSRSGEVSGRLVDTLPSQLRTRRVIARFAQMAREVNAAYAQFGPDQPWEFASPRDAFPCSPRFCGHYARCPGGAGLDVATERVSA